MVLSPQPNEMIQMPLSKYHFLIKCTKEAIKQQFYISKLTMKIENVIANCVLRPYLLGNKKIRDKSFLNLLMKDDAPLHTYHLDHLGPLDSINKNYNHISVVVDSFTKLIWLYHTNLRRPKKWLLSYSCRAKCLKTRPALSLTEVQHFPPQSLRIIVKNRELSM